MALQRGAMIPVNPHVQKLGVAISWDKGPAIVDVDLQALVVDDRGTITDAVYYNNLKALKGALTHSGDEQSGDKVGLDECVWVTLKKLPPNIKLILYVVAAYARGHLRDVMNGRIHVLEDDKDNQSAVYEMERSAAEVDAVLMLVRSDNGDFYVHVIEEPAERGKHFMDILEPTIGNLIRAVIPGAPRRQKVAFAMEKGAVVDLPDTCMMSRITAGLGWDASRAGGSIDLDVSVVCFSKDGAEVGAVFFGNTKEFGIVHSGDNLTGEGSGDDEAIQVDLRALPPQIEQMIFSVNIYTRGTTFDQVSNAYCRICDDCGHEMARYILSQGRGQTGLLIARLFREPGGDRWGFQALGSFCAGNTYKDSLPAMRQYVGMSARDYQLRSSPSMYSEQPIHGHVVGQPSVAYAPAPVYSQRPPKRSGDCLIQ